MPTEETPASALSLSSSEGEGFAATNGAGNMKENGKGKQRASVDGGATASPAADSWIPARSWVHFVAGGCALSSRRRSCCY